MPKLLKTPFAIDAAEGFRTDIQESTGAAPNSATYQVGFPPVTMQSIASNGIPPKGSDLNGVLYDITDNLVFLTQGGGYGFDSAYATSIGGYPLNARLRLTNGYIVKNTIDGNTNDPNVDMTGWELSNSETLTEKKMGLVGDPNLDGDATEVLEKWALLLNGRSDVTIKLSGEFDVSRTIFFRNMKNLKILGGKFNNLVTDRTQLSPNNFSRGAICLVSCEDSIVTTKVKGNRQPFPAYGVEEGVSGIDLYRCVNTGVVGSHISDTHTWSVTGMECTNCYCVDSTLENVTRQSAISIFIGDGSENYARGNTIRNAGLYGVEVECTELGNTGEANKNPVVENNDIRMTFSGVTTVGYISNPSVRNNTIKDSYFGLSLSINPAASEGISSIAKNTVTGCLYGFNPTRSKNFEHIDNVYSATPTRTHFISSPYSTLVGFVSPREVILIDSRVKTNGFTFNIGFGVLLEGTENEVTVTGVEYLADYGDYPANTKFVKLTLSSDISDLFIGQFVYVNKNNIAQTTVGVALSSNLNGSSYNNTYKDFTRGCRFSQHSTIAERVVDIQNESFINCTPFHLPTVSRAGLKVGKCNYIEPKISGTIASTIKDAVNERTLKFDNIVPMRNYPQQNQTFSDRDFSGWIGNPTVCVGFLVNYTDLVVTGRMAIILNGIDTGARFGTSQPINTAVPESGTVFIPISPIAINNNYTYRLTQTETITDSKWSEITLITVCM